MNSTLHLTDNQLVLLYYREPLEEAGLDGHLAGCAECLERFQTLTRVLHAVAQDEIPEPAGDFEARMTIRVLAAARAKPKVEPRGRLLHFPRVARFVAVGAALAACLMLAFNAGRDRGRADEQILSAAQAKQRVLLTALSDHLGRSRVTLVELKNRDASAADLVALQAAADNLINASRLFRAAAERAGEAQVAGVMEETERLLIRFAAADPKDAGAELAGLRKRVESRDLLFRLQVMEAQIEKREQSIASSSRRSL